MHYLLTKKLVNGNFGFLQVSEQPSYGLLLISNRHTDFCCLDSKYLNSYQRPGCAPCAAAPAARAARARGWSCPPGTSPGRCRSALPHVACHHGPGYLSMHSAQLPGGTTPWSQMSSRRSPEAGCVHCTCRLPLLAYSSTSHVSISVSFLAADTCDPSSSDHPSMAQNNMNCTYII